jgi:hypothetical protein
VLAQELLNDGGQTLGLVLGDEGAAPGHGNEASLGKEACEAPSVLGRKELVLRRPNDERRLVEASQRLCRLVGVADIDGTQQSRKVAPDSGTPADGVGVGTHDPRLDRVSGRPAVGEGQTLDESRLNRLRHAPHQSARARDPQQIALRARRELLERIARGEDKPSDALGVVADEPLRDGAAGVVGDDRDVGALLHGVRVRSEREVGRDAAAPFCKPGHDTSPEVAVHPDAVDENDRRATAALAILDHPPGRATDRRSPSAALMDTTASRWRAPCFVDGG